MHIATKVGTLAIGGRRFEAGVIDIFFVSNVYIHYAYMYMFAMKNLFKSTLLRYTLVTFNDFGPAINRNVRIEVNFAAQISSSGK